MLTLFHPATGQVRVKGITTCPNTVLHEWLQEQLTHILALLPAPPELSPAQNRERWQQWQEGLQIAPSIGEDMPPLRLLLVLDNLSGHHTPSFVMWLCEHGIMPLYTPLGGSWLNMSESIQRIIVRRALDGEHPSTPQQIIDWLEQTAEGWNADPTPFVWGGKRKRRRDRARDRRHALGGSGACSRRVLRPHRNMVAQRQEA
jgi:DDE superfamily endonuclease